MCIYTFNPLPLCGSYAGLGWSENILVSCFSCQRNLADKKLPTHLVLVSCIWRCKTESSDFKGIKNLRLEDSITHLWITLYNVSIYSLL